MVVALIALLASLAGTATAAKVLITSKDIKNGTIQPIDLSAKAKRVLKARRGPAGPPGSAGEQGPQGSQGPQGPPISFTNAYSGQVTVANGSFAFADAICPTGKQVVGGGYATENVGTALLVPTNSYPIGTGDGRSAWYVAGLRVSIAARLLADLAFVMPGSDEGGVEDGGDGGDGDTGPRTRTSSELLGIAGSAPAPAVADTVGSP